MINYTYKQNYDLCKFNNISLGYYRIYFNVNNTRVPYYNTFIVWDG